jgi:hypothetical protein
MPLRLAEATMSPVDWYADASLLNKLSFELFVLSKTAEHSYLDSGALVVVSCSHSNEVKSKAHVSLVYQLFDVEPQIPPNIIILS